MKEHIKQYILIQDNNTLKKYNYLIKPKYVKPLSDTITNLPKSSTFSSYRLYSVKTKLNIIKKEFMKDNNRNVICGTKKAMYQCLGYELKTSPNIVYLFVDYEIGDVTNEPKK